MVEATLVAARRVPDVGEADGITGTTGTLGPARRGSLHPSLARRTPYDTADWFDPDVVAEARRYQRPLKRLAIVRAALGSVALLVFLFAEGGPRVIDALDVRGWVLQLVVVVAALHLVDFLYEPWLTAYQELVHDKRWGLSTQTVGGWAKDQVKALVLSTVVLSAMLVPVYAVIRATSWWWLGAAIVLMGVQLVLAFVYPVLLMPVFNKFTPLPDGDLRSRVDGVAARAGLAIEGAYTMDASRRTRRDNAFVAGFGRTRRVVLYDTIVEHPPEVVEQVVAHEIGHYRLRHILKGIPFSTLLVLAAFAFTKVITDWDTLLDWAGVTTVEDPAALPVFLLGFGLAYKVVSLAQAWRARWFERQADLEALELLADPTAFIESWRRMAPKNKVDLEPSWWKRLQQSHPEVPERMAFGKAWADANQVPVDPKVLEPVTLPAETPTG